MDVDTGMSIEQATKIADEFWANPSGQTYFSSRLALHTLAAEVRRLREATKHMTTSDGAIVQPTDTVWVAGQSTVSKFYVANDWTVPLAVCDDAGEGWHDLPVSECYSTSAAAEAARERGGT